MDTWSEPKWKGFSVLTLEVTPMDQLNQWDPSENWAPQRWVLPTAFSFKANL